MMIVPASFRYVIILAIMCVHKAATAPTTTDTSDAPSYKSCTFDTLNATLDCSNLGLTAIPKDIPNTILILKMSFNNLGHLTNETLGGNCCRQLQEIDLSNNKISNIDRDSFKSLENLTRIILRKNEIGELNSEAFKDMKFLDFLDLSYNKIKIGNSFIVNSKLREILLDHCDIDEIPSEAFKGISQLDSLSLEGNSLENFDASFFDHLPHLTTLRMHNLSRDSIVEICDKLEEMDSIYFEGFNVSCFVLSEKGPEHFEEAVVGIDKPLAQPVYHPTTTTQKPATTTTLTPITSSIPIMNFTGGEVSVTTEIVTIHETTTAEVNSAVVDVDNETINYMLIGILAVTTLGIAIGLICRADVCSIKTKLCRSNKNQNRARKPEDSVSPFEEIPLNTISNGNGKTSNEG